jgi:transposase InsO family protein
MFAEDKLSDAGTHYMRYVNKGYSQSQARILSKSFIMINVCLSISKHYSTDIIFYALQQLVNSNPETNKYQFTFKLNSVRTFYNYLKKASNDRIEDIIEHGLLGKPSNRKSISKSTEDLVVELLKHFNQLSDETVTGYANTIIIALPLKYNNGKCISRQKVNQIKNGKRSNEIKVALFGNSWTKQNLLPNINRVKTQYPLDCVEVDFTKVHCKVVDENFEETKLFICRIIDRCTKAIIGLSSGRSECFDLFQIAYRRMLELTEGNHPVEIVHDDSTAFNSTEFKRIKAFLEGLGIKVTLTRNCQAKGSVESHFKTLFDTYLPQHVGSLGGNIATTKKHRPKHEILILLQKKEYMENVVEWDKILRNINDKYNDTPKNGNAISPMEEFTTFDQPHAIHIEEKYLAFLSWHRTTRKFVESEFKVEFDKKVFHFGWKSEEILESPDKAKFLMERTGDQFDVYMHPISSATKSLYVFEKDTLKFLYTFKASQMYYGNYIDHQINPDRKKELQKAINSRNRLKAMIDNNIKDLSKKLKQELGVDLTTFLKEKDKNGEISKMKPNLGDSVMDLLENREAIQIDPFTSEVSTFRNKKAVKRNKHKPQQVKFKK